MNSNPRDYTPTTVAHVACRLAAVVWLSACSGSPAASNDSSATTLADTTKVDMGSGDLAGADIGTTDNSPYDAVTPDSLLQAVSHLCDPCTSNDQCATMADPDARCIGQGPAGSYCGIPCVLSQQCPDDYVCATVKDVAGTTTTQCVRAPGLECICSQAAQAAHLATSCYASPQTSACLGLRTCLAAGEPGAPSGGGLGTCSAPVAVTETCDGADNDCDGSTDEGTCDDKNACTSDTCKGTGGCEHVSMVGECDDGDACTSASTCEQGACAGGNPISCDDKNPCTTDTCNVATGCLHVPAADGIPCDDGAACSVGDKCTAGFCGKPTIWNVKVAAPSYDCSLIGMLEDGLDGVTIYGDCPATTELNRQPIATRLDAYGTVVWSSTGAAPTGLVLTAGTGLGDGSFLAVGHVAKGTPVVTQVALVRWLPGVATPTTVVEADQPTALASAVTAVADGYLLGVAVGGEARVQHRDLSGAVVWQTTVGSQGTVIKSLAALTNGFVAAGYIQEQVNKPAVAWLARFESPTKQAWSANLAGSGTNSAKWLAVAASATETFAVGYAGFDAIWRVWDGSGATTASGSIAALSGETTGAAAIFTDLVPNKNSWLIGVMSGGGLSPSWAGGFRLWDGKSTPEAGFGGLENVQSGVLVRTWSGGIDAAAVVVSGAAPYPGWQVRRVAWNGQTTCP